MDIHNIKHRVIDKNLAFKNRFEVFIPDFGESTLLANECNLPQLTLNSVPYRQFPPNRQDINDVVYDDLVVNFLVDSNYQIRLLFQTWYNQIINLTDGSWNYREEYLKDITINLLDRQDNVKLEITFFDVHPKQIGELAQSYESSDEIQTMNVVFAYRYYELASPDGNQLNIPLLNELQTALEIAEGVRSEVRIIDEAINRNVSIVDTQRSRIESFRRS